MKCRPHKWGSWSAPYQGQILTEPRLGAEQVLEPAIIRTRHCLCCGRGENQLVDRGTLGRAMERKTR